MTSEADNLVALAQKQLDEHKKWLAGQIYMVPLIEDASKVLLAAQVEQIRLRVARCTNHATISVVWEYPDELYAFLVSERSPQHLRGTLDGAHVVDPNQPASSMRRVRDEG